MPFLRALGGWIASRRARTVALALAFALPVGAALLPAATTALRGRPGLLLAGIDVTREGVSIAVVERRVRAYLDEPVALVLPDGAEQALPRRALGGEIDAMALATLLEQARDPGAELSRRAGLLSGPLALPIPVRVDGDIALPVLLAIKQELDRPADDARIDIPRRLLLPEQVGRMLDVYRTVARLEEALRSGASRVEVAFTEEQPRLTAERLGHVRFDHVIGWYETRYADGADDGPRVYNLRQAASRIDGRVIPPGGVFDFNAVVGPRDEAHGFQIAPVIDAGELVDGLGGGTCQISGTLHAAALFAGMEILERHPHSRPSYYIKLGLDATVVYPKLTLRIRNSFDFPVVLHETVRSGRVRAEILGPPRRLTVTYSRRIEQVIGYEQVVRRDPRVPKGTRVLAQRGIPGFITQSSRELTTGERTTREVWTDRYPPTTQIVLRGTGKGRGGGRRDPVREDKHDEYLVDELLTLAQGPELSAGMNEKLDLGGVVVVAREPGRTGKPGWTRREGFPQFGKTSERRARRAKARQAGRPGQEPAGY